MCVIEDPKIISPIYHSKIKKKPHKHVFRIVFMTINGLLHEDKNFCLQYMYGN